MDSDPSLRRSAALWNLHTGVLNGTIVGMTSAPTFNETGENTLEWPKMLRALRSAWQPLVAYELSMSLLSTLVLGPLLVASTYEVIALSDDAALGNWHLIRFLLTPLGLIALLLGGGVALGLLFVEYAGLILLADAAVRGTRLTLRQLLGWLFWAAPRLFGLGAWHSGLALLAALPILGLAAGSYWLLLGATDINFYLEARPPRFWLCAAIIAALATVLTLVLIGIGVRLVFAIPACVLDGQGWWQSTRLGGKLARGRLVRLLLLIGAWEAAKYVIFVMALVVLDGLNGWLLSYQQAELGSLLWSTVLLLLFDSAVMQVLAALFAIGLAVVIAQEYERARVGCVELAVTTRPLVHAPELTVPQWRTRVVLLIVTIAGPVASLLYALALERELVEQRAARVTAHRAGPKQAPENSIAALQLALAAHADFVEIDVQLTADGQVVLLHDRDLKRVTGDRRAIAEVAHAHLSDLRLLFGGAASDQQVPTLSEFLTACDDRIRLNIELKEFGQSGPLPAAVLEVLADRQFKDRAVVSSFEMPLLTTVRRLAPEVPIGIILSASKGDPTRLPVDFLSLHQRLVRAELVRRAHRRGQEVHAWTVNDRETALRLLDFGCDNLITSDPVAMREIVDWYAELGGPERMVLRLRRWMRQ